MAAPGHATSEPSHAHAERCGEKRAHEAVAALDPKRQRAASCTTAAPLVPTAVPPATPFSTPSGASRVSASSASVSVPATGAMPDAETPPRPEQPRAPHQEKCSYEYMVRFLCEPNHLCLATEACERLEGFEASRNAACVERVAREVAAYAWRFLETPDGAPYKASFHLRILAMLCALRFYFHYWASSHDGGRHDDPYSVNDICEMVYGTGLGRAHILSCLGALLSSPATVRVYDPPVEVAGAAAAAHDVTRAE